MSDDGRDYVDWQTQLVGSDGSTRADIISGRISVSPTPPATPPTATSVIITQSSDVSGTIDHVYTITSGKTLQLNLFSAGAEASVSGAVCKLYYDPNGDGSALTLIEAIYENGATSQVTLDEQYTGDGTRAIRLRRTNLTGGSVEITAKWVGYEA